MQRVEFNLHETISKSLEIFHHKASEKSLELTCSIHEKVPETWIGDPQRLRQVMINLVGNAVKFTDQGSIHIETKFSNGEINITVTDTGIGIAADQLEKIFERFTQGDASITRKYGGTGLGLHITKNLVEKMDGRIQVHSENGKGSRFTLTLPALSGL
ncbi:Signal transduction histidine-protein kinase BarA [compost metagenome]